MTDTLKTAGLFLGFLALGTVVALAWAGLVVLAILSPWLIEIAYEGVSQIGRA